MPAGNSYLKPFRYLIVTPTGSAIHTFYAHQQSIADRDAKDWARRRNATKLTRQRRPTAE